MCIVSSISINKRPNFFPIAEYCNQPGGLIYNGKCFLIQNYNYNNNVYTIAIQFNDYGTWVKIKHSLLRIEAWYLCCEVTKILGLYRKDSWSCLVCKWKLFNLVKIQQTTKKDLVFFLDAILIWYLSITNHFLFDEDCALDIIFVMFLWIFFIIFLPFSMRRRMVWRVFLTGPKYAC